MECMSSDRVIGFVNFWSSRFAETKSLNFGRQFLKSAALIPDLSSSSQSFIARFSTVDSSIFESGTLISDYQTRRSSVPRFSKTIGNWQSLIDERWVLVCAIFFVDLRCRISKTKMLIPSFHIHYFRSLIRPFSKINAFIPIRSFVNV